MTSPADDALLAIRRSIRSITTQRDAAVRSAAAAVVNQAAAGRAVRVQQDRLRGVEAEIDAAAAEAEQLAERVRAEDGTAAATPYAMHAAGLRAQHDVVGAAAQQLSGLRVAADENAARARRLLTATTRTLDAALREQLRLLDALERLEQARVVAAGPGMRGR